MTEGRVVMGAAPSRVVEMPSVILITDPQWSCARIIAVIEAAAKALAPGALLVQLRDKAVDAASLRASARTLQPIARIAGARFVINAPTREALRVAIDVRADGAHVPHGAIADARVTLGMDAWISTPIHADEDVKTLSLEDVHAVTAVLVSPIWDSPGKGKARGVGALTSTRRALDAREKEMEPRRQRERILLYALGGVDAQRAAFAADAGADGVAVIRALLDAEDPQEVARALDAPFHGRAAATRQALES